MALLPTKPHVGGYSLAASLRAASVAFVLLGLSGPVTASGPDVLIPYGSGGYRYQVVDHGEGEGFQAPAFDDSAWAVGRAPFGSEPGCGFEPNTDWPVETDILVRREIQLSKRLSRVKIAIAIDNNVRIYWDGVLVGSQDHEGCAERGSLVVTLPQVTRGTHVLAVRGIDDEFLSLLDIRLAARRVPNCCR